MVALALALLAAPALALDQPTYLGPKPKPTPTRIITIAPSLTETVIALGAKDRLVGVSRFDELPDVAKLPRVGGFIDPSVEAVLSLKPDLVLVQPAPGNKGPVEKMAELGVPVLAVPMHDVASTLAAIREIGKALGLPGQGEALARDIESARASEQKAHAAQPSPTVLIVYGFQPFVVAGKGSFASELLSDCHAKNLAADSSSPYPVWSAEQAALAKVDIVLVASDTDSGIEQFRGLPNLSRAKWVKPKSQDLLHPGPNLARGLRELCALIR